MRSTHLEKKLDVLVVGSICLEEILISSNNLCYASDSLREVDVQENYA